MKNKVMENKDDLILFEDHYTRMTSLVSLSYLLTELTKKEFRVFSKILLKVETDRNIICSYNNKTTLMQLSKDFSVSYRITRKVFDKLYKLGVYRQSFNDSNCWVLSPYISYMGESVYSDIVDLFSDTLIAKNYYSKLENKTE
jgi:hypothetical protein